MNDTHGLSPKWLLALPILWIIGATASILNYI